MSGRTCFPEKVRDGPWGYPVPETPAATSSVKSAELTLGPGVGRGMRQPQTWAKLRLVRETGRGHSQSLNWQCHAGRDPGSLNHGSIPVPSTPTHTQNRWLGICQSELIAKGGFEWPLREGWSQQRAVGA